MQHIDHLNLELELKGLRLNGVPSNLPIEDFLRLKDIVIEKKLNEMIDRLNSLSDKLLLAQLTP